MARMNHRGAIRAAIAYVLVVGGGTFLVVMTGLNALMAAEDNFGGHAHAQVSLLALLGLNLKLFLRLSGSLYVLIWLFVGVLIYLCGLLLQKLKAPVLGRLILAVVSSFLSCGIISFLAPVGWPSIAAVLLTILGVGVLVAAVGFFMFPRICEESFQARPLGRGHCALISVWALYLVGTWGYNAYASAKVHTLDDPGIDIVFLKWSPGEGEVREEPIGKYDSYYPRMNNEEITELRAAGLTGVIQGWGNNHLPGPGVSSRVVLIMSRGVRETVDLRKPASGDIIYLQTQEGWRLFPPSAPTLPRTMRLTIQEPNVHHTYPDQMVTVDIGLGHPDPAYGLNTFSWSPEEFQAPLPSLPSQNADLK